MAGRNFNQRMRAARQRSGLTLEDVYVELRARLPRRWCPSPPTLHRLEMDRPEEKVNPLVLCALAEVYRVELADLTPMTAEDLPRLSELLSSNREPDGAVTRRYRHHTIPTAA